MADADRRKAFYRVPLDWRFPADTPREKLPWWAQPMNCQEKRTETTRQILLRCGIKRIVETGTYLGTTAAFFGGFGVPVTTVEYDPELAQDAMLRLRSFPNVDVRTGDSVRVLQAFVREKLDKTVPTFFYCDAHYGTHQPLREEMRLAVTHFPNAVVMADDFTIPDDPGYAQNLDGQRLDLGYLLQGDLTRLAVFFPRDRGADETGARKGCVVVTDSEAMITALNGVPGLRRFRTRWR